MNFKEYISTLSLDELREHQNILCSTIVQKQSAPAPILTGLSESVVEKRDVNDYVTYQDRFLDNVDIQSLMAECMSLGFNRKAKNNSVQNRFVSMFAAPYSWDSSGGPVVNNPVSMQEFPAIQRVMENINSAYGFKQNCSLVSFYKNGQVRARLHSDDEDELDHTQPIAVVSLGAVRAVEFVDNAQESFRYNALSLNPSEGSLYIMQPGCQQHFRHRVRMNKRVKNLRISLSFRAFVPPPTDQSPKPSPPNSASSPIQSDASFATCGSEAGSPISNADPEIPPKMSQHPMPDMAKGTDMSFLHNPVAPGYSPFSSHMEHEAVSREHVDANEKLCVIFGTSISEYVDGGMLSKKDRTVVNVSSPGANIDDIRTMANDFHQENLRSIHKIDQIVVSVGTNDIKWYDCFDRNLRRDLKPKLITLVKELKQLFTSAQIYFHTVLPMRIVYKYTAASVHQFNNLLYEVCCQYRCFFFDCFARFLDQQGIFYNRALFRDNWHLSTAGLKVFCRALKFMIHGKLFNPLPRFSCYPMSYPC